MNKEIKTLRRGNGASREKDLRSEKATIEVMEELDLKGSKNPIKMGSREKRRDQFRAVANATRTGVSQDELATELFEKSERRGEERGKAQRQSGSRGGIYLGQVILPGVKTL